MIFICLYLGVWLLVLLDVSSTKTEMQSAIFCIRAEFIPVSDQSVFFLF